ncbi:MAG: hypothetical protein M0Q41_10580 [Bacteroidales bacterium]|nr:hypothetical protein [Bacteroidales bacterium]
MLSLDKDLQKLKLTLEEFSDVTIRVLQYLPNVISKSEVKENYTIYSSEIAGTTKFIRPINSILFIKEPETFSEKFKLLKDTLEKVRENKSVSIEEKNNIDSVVYTIQQAIGAGSDLLVNPNSARKHVGNRFEELIKAIFSKIGVSNKKLILQIPYETEKRKKVYKVENDLILSTYEKVKSTATSLDEREIVVSVKTTSKDRMGKIFIDKILLERFVNHPQKVIGIFQNDVQRKGSDNISYTLVSGLFMVYTKFLTKLEGIYYLDPPPIALKKPYSDYIKRFSELIVFDHRKLLAP